MLDIPELDTMVYQCLSERDFARCALVCKKWHALVMPHLWRDLAWLKKSPKNLYAFVRILHNGYRDAIRRQELLDKGDRTMGQPTPPQSSSSSSSSSVTASSPPPSSVLSKYARWIRVLPDTSSLKDPCLLGFEPLLHLFKLCSPSVQVDRSSISTWDLDRAPYDTHRQMVEFAIPRARCLGFHVHLLNFHAQLSRTVNLFNQCSGTLQRLELSVDIPLHQPDFKEEEEEEPTDNDPKPWTLSLKELALCHWTDVIGINPFHTWFFKQCSQVVRLEIHNTHGHAKLLAQAMLTHMPLLTEIALGCDTYRSGRLSQAAVSTLLSGSRQGWKRIEFGTEAGFGPLAIAALNKHLTTLETLISDACIQFEDYQRVRVLRTAQKLCSFKDIRDYGCGAIQGVDFIDQDERTGDLRPWECEATLKQLKIKLSRLTVMDADGFMVGVSMTHGRQAQFRLHDRLARFTRLEVLWIKGDPCGGKFKRGKYTKKTWLSNGLPQLAGLKALKELGIESMFAKIGVEEMEWMTKNWPELRTIRGLGRDVGELKATKWLQEHHPLIDVSLDSRYGLK
ncbi:MAG: hypothetical protein J3Q66DRAFT_58287 [Benniella sp.]|nr:MAG: hypothetical protein J3Q66DRAFT_58287 [Benniella sp.]